MEEFFAVHGQQKCESRMWHPYTPSKGFLKGLILLFFSQEQVM